MAYGSVLTDVVQSSTAGTPPQFNDGSGVQTGTLCRAWVNFNGVTTATVRASFNVSSVTRNATGDYTVNFTTALPDANYSCTFSCNGNSTGMQAGVQISGTATAPTLFSASQIRINAGATSGGTNLDMANVSAMFFR